MNPKSFVTGAITATVGIATVFGAGVIKSADFNENKVVFDGKELDISAQPMISVVKEGETNASNYMPVRAVLESMGYTVSWDGEKKAVIVDSVKPDSAKTDSAKPVADETVKSPAHQSLIEQRTLSPEKIDGYWIADYVDSSSGGLHKIVRYKFEKGGNAFQSSEILDDNGKQAWPPVIAKGKYTIIKDDQYGDMLNIEYEYFYQDGEVLKLGPEEKFEAGNMDFSEDGSTWEDYRKFERDTNPNDWDKEIVTTTVKEEIPTVDEIKGYWITTTDLSTLGSGKTTGTSTTKYKFGDDGKYIERTDSVVEGKKSYNVVSGKYTVEAGMLVLTADYWNSDGEIMDMQYPEEPVHYSAKDGLYLLDTEGRGRTEIFQRDANPGNWADELQN